MTLPLFSNLYHHVDDRIDPYFTIWAALPPQAAHYIAQCLRSIVGECEWLVGFDEQRIPHITLRYLGYASAELEQQALHDLATFSAAIHKIDQPIIELGEFTIFIAPDGTKRVNWAISGGQALARLHQQLLKVPGYALYDALEGVNYTPHVSVGKIRGDADIARVGYFLASRLPTPYRTQLDKFELNFCGIDKGFGPIRGYQVPIGT